LDEETGFYYYRARYYKPRTNLWQSPDPALPEFLDGEGNGGIFRSSNLASYSYAYNNPVRLTDPDGRQPDGDEPNYSPTVLFDRIIAFMFQRKAAPQTVASPAPAPAPAASNYTTGSAVVLSPNVKAAMSSLVDKYPAATKRETARYEWNANTLIAGWSHV